MVGIGNKVDDFSLSATGNTVLSLADFNGRKFMGIVRSTFLIDKNGILRREWRKVRVKGHVDEVLNAVKAL